jgi:hypothetical protein
LGGIPPYASPTKNIKTGGSRRDGYEIDENEAPIVRENFRLAAEGPGTGIAERLIETVSGQKLRRVVKITLKDMVGMKVSGTLHFQKGNNTTITHKETTLFVILCIPAIVIPNIGRRYTTLTLLPGSRFATSPLLKGFVYCGDCGRECIHAG